MGQLLGPSAQVRTELPRSLGSRSSSLELRQRTDHISRESCYGLGVGKGGRVPRQASGSRASAPTLHEAYYRGAAAVREELEALLDGVDRVIAAVDQSPDLSAAQRTRLIGMLLNVRTGYRGPLEP
jgi:hypothetical protein